MDLGFITLNSPSELVSGLVLAIVALALGVRKLHAMYASDGVSIAKTNSELDVITLLREQIQDLAKANKELREEIEQLRRLNNSLINENDQIKYELRMLRDEIGILREENAAHKKSKESLGGQTSGVSGSGI